MKVPKQLPAVERKVSKHAARSSGAKVYASQSSWAKWLPPMLSDFIINL